MKSKKSSESQILKEIIKIKANNKYTPIIIDEKWKNSNKNGIKRGEEVREKIQEGEKIGEEVEANEKREERKVTKGGGNGVGGRGRERGQEAEGEGEGEEGGGKGKEGRVKRRVEKGQGERENEDKKVGDEKAKIEERWKVGEDNNEIPTLDEKMHDNQKERIMHSIGLIREVKKREEDQRIKVEASSTEQEFKLKTEEQIIWDLIEDDWEEVDGGTKKDREREWEDKLIYQEDQDDKIDEYEATGKIKEVNEAEKKEEEKEKDKKKPVREEDEEEGKKEEEEKGWNEVDEEKEEEEEEDANKRIDGTEDGEEEHEFNEEGMGSFMKDLNRHLEGLSFENEDFNIYYPRFSSEEEGEENQEEQKSLEEIRVLTSRQKREKIFL